MKTFEMVALADQNGKTYRACDMRYSKEKGFHQECGEVWDYRAYSDQKDPLNAFMHECGWEEEPVKFNFNDFINRKITVNCKSENDANLFFAYLTGKGLSWNNESLMTNNRWSTYNFDTCYSFNSSGFVSYGFRRYYENVGWDVVEFNTDMLK